MASPLANSGDDGLRPPTAVMPALRVHATALWSSWADEPDPFRHLVIGVTAAYGLALAGDLDLGLVRLQQVTTLALGRGFEATVMKARGSIGHVHLLRSEPGPARALLLDCLSQAEHLGNVPGQLMAHEILSAVCDALGDAGQASVHRRSARQLIQQRNQRCQEARSQIARDRAALRQAMDGMDREWAAPA